MKYVVTGASGFIGRALVECLRASLAGEVVAVSRRVQKRCVCVDHYRDTPTGDVLVHLAEDADRCAVNLAGEQAYQDSTALLKCLLQKGYGLVLYISSAVVYGDQAKRPYREDAPVEGVDTYTRIKLDNEANVLSAGGIVVRLSNVIGPDMARSNVLSDIVAQVPGQGPLIVRNARPVRDFVWVTDVVDGVLALLRIKAAGLFNLGTGQGVSIQGLAELVLAQSGETRRTIASLASAPTHSYNVVDISKLKQEIDWIPRWTVKDAIQSLVPRSSLSTVRN